MSTESVNIQIQEDGSRAVVSNFNAVADSADKAGSRTDAFQKILSANTSVMDKVSIAIDRLNATMTANANATQGVSKAQENAAKSSVALTESVAQNTVALTAKDAATKSVTASTAVMGETEAETTARIHAMVAASLEQVAALNATATAAGTSAGSVAALAEADTAAGVAAQASADSYGASAGAYVRKQLAIDALYESMDGGIKTMEQWRNVEGGFVAAVSSGAITTKQFESAMVQLDAQMPKTTKSMAGAATSAGANANAVENLLKKYDPLQTKLVALEKDEIALRAARDAGTISSEAYAKAQETIAVEQLAVQKALEGGTAAIHLNGRATREVGTVIEEVATGNMGRLKMSLGALANSTGLFAKLLSPLGLGLLGLVGIFAALVAGVIAGYEAFNKLNTAVIITGQSSGQTTGSIQALSESMATANVNAHQTQELLTSLVGTGRTTSDSFQTIGKAAQNMLALTGSSVEEVTNSFSKLYDDPIAWAEDMDTKWHFLTQDTLDHAQHLVDVGDKYGAAKVIAAAFADDTKAKIDELNASMGTLARLAQTWSQGWANIKGDVMSIGAPKDATAQFTELNDKYKEWLAQTKGLNSEYIRSVDLDFQTRLKALLPAAQNLQLLARTKEANDQNRQALLDAQHVQESVNDKTQKQVELQQKLKELRLSYQTTHNLGGEFTKGADAGVTFDADGNPSGGAYASKVKALTEQYDGKPKAAKAPKTGDAAIRDWLEQERTLQSLLDTIDSTTAANDKLSKAQDTLAAAVKRGDLTQKQADADLALYKLQLGDTLDPLAALNKKLDDQIASFQGTAQQSKASMELERQRQDLLKSGIVLTAEQTAELVKKNAAVQAGLADQALEEKVLRSVTNATRDQITELQQLNRLKDAGSLTQDQVNQYEFKKNPEVFKGTGFAQDQQLKGQADQLALIKQMNKDKVLNERDTHTAIRNNEIQTQRIRLQGTQQFLGSLSGLMSTHNKTQFAIGKAAAIAQAGINTYLSATEAFSSLAGIPIVGPILGGIAAAAAVAAGLAQIQQIRSQQMQGYQAGGYTGNGGVSQIAGVVHGQEWVSNAATTQKYRPQLEAMQNGTYEAPAAQQAPAQINVTAGDTRVIMVDDQRDVGNYLNSDAGEKIIVTTMRRNNG